jgi:iron complex transport system ATP-binding protein
MTLATSELTLAGRLSGVTAELRPGEVTAICGPNGAGKSSLLASLAGLIVPQSGSVALDGVALDAMTASARAQAIGFLPQSPEVAWDVAVEVLVSLGRLPWPEPGQRAVETAMATLDLAHLRHRPVSSLSGGERARALIARVLAGEPRWLLADEPLANLDLAHAASLVSALRDQACDGRGVVLVLHDLAQAMNHADRVLVLDRGRLVADGRPQEALSASAIAEVWGVEARWLGAAGAMALALAG